MKGERLEGVKTKMKIERKQRNGEKAQNDKGENGERGMESGGKKMNSGKGKAGWKEN